MHACKLSIIVIVANESCIVKRQIGTDREIQIFKYRGIWSYRRPIYLQVVNGSRHLIFKFWDFLHIPKTVGARNFKFGRLIDRQGQ